MSLAMPYVRVKQKFQVTLPSSIRHEMNIEEGDTLEVCTEDGNILLKPQTVSDRKISRGSIRDLIGANRDSGLYKDAKEVDETIAKLRREWD